jgi:hypothetical protein
MRLLSFLKKNAVVILFILAILGLVLYMNYKPEGFQGNMPNLPGMPKNAPPPSSGPTQGGRR